MLLSPAPLWTVARPVFDTCAGRDADASWKLQVGRTARKPSTSTGCSAQEHAFAQARKRPRITPRLWAMGRVVFLFSLVGLARLAAAQPAAPAAGDLAHRSASYAETWTLGFEEALGLLDRAPELRARETAVKQLRASRTNVGALPSDLGVRLEAGPQLFSSIEPLGRVEVSQAFALASLGDARRGVLTSRASALDAERNSLRVLRRTQVAETWLRVHSAHASLRIAEAEYGLAQELVRATTRAAEVSELTRADAADAEAYAAEAKLGVLAAEGDLVDARLELTDQLAVADHVLDTGADPPDVPEPTPEQERMLHARIDQQPGLRRLLEKLAVLDAQERELRAAHASQLSLGVAVDHADPRAWSLLGLVGFTLPLEDRAQRERAELAAERAAELGGLSEARARWHVAIERLLHEIRHTHETLEHAEMRLLPAVEAGLLAREKLLRAGEGTVLEIVVARRAALSLRMRCERLRTAQLSARMRFRELSLAVGALR